MAAAGAMARARGSRSDKPHHRPRPEHGEVAATTPAVATAAPTPQAAETPRPPRDHHAHKRQDGGKPQQRKVESEKVDVNALPAFLLRPVILPKPVEKPAPRAPRKKKTEADA